MDENIEYSTYPCTGCGVCCKRVDRAIKAFDLGEKSKLYFPYKHDGNGRCEMLTDDNKCSVYENRPLICNVDALLELSGMPKQAFYALNIHSCNKLMDEDGVPINFRIKI